MLGKREYCHIEAGIKREVKEVWRIGTKIALWGVCGIEGKLGREISALKGEFTKNQESKD